MRRLSRLPHWGEKFKSRLGFLLNMRWADPRNLEGLRTVVQNNFHDLTGLEVEIASHFEL
jgi:hypothetical protein